MQLIAIPSHCAASNRRRLIFQNISTNTQVIQVFEMLQVSEIDIHIQHKLLYIYLCTILHFYDMTYFCISLFSVHTYLSTDIYLNIAQRDKSGDILVTFLFFAIRCPLRRVLLRSKKKIQTTLIFSIFEANNMTLNCLQYILSYCNLDCNNVCVETRSAFHPKHLTYSKLEFWDLDLDI